MTTDSVSWSKVIKHGLGKYLRLNKPVVIKEVPTSFPPMSWSLESLVEKFGDTQIRILRSRTGFFSYDDKSERDIISLSLREFYEKGVLNRGADGYYYALGRSPIQQFGNLYEEMKLPAILSRIVDGPMRLPERNLWISPKGTRTALHFDAVENLNLQIEGSKSFLIFAPRIKNMHCNPLNSQAAYISSVDPRSENACYSDFPREEGEDVVLHKGDMLYLPYGWWHQVDTIGDQNMNANYWWFPRIKLATYPRQTARGAAVLLHRMGSHPHKRAEKMSSQK
ncbi:MAG: cupin-like domain-containing protein [Prochlorococcaceae cyanobacterium]|jgi:hypothetical protein